MKLTQQQKETIFNNYMMLVDKLAEHIDHKSEISPKEIVYSVLALVEDQLSVWDKGNCPACQQGNLKELSIYDDWEGMLTCDKCGARVKT